MIDIYDGSVCIGWKGFPTRRDGICICVLSLVIQNQLLTSNPSNDLSIPYGHKGILVWVEDLQFLRKSQIKAFEAVEEAVIGKYYYSLTWI